VSSQDVFMTRLQPFLKDIWTEIENSGHFKQAVLKASAKHRLAANYFYIDLATIEYSFSLANNYIFPEDNSLKYLDFINRNTGKKLRVKLKNEAILPKIHSLLYYCGSGIYSKNQLNISIEESLIHLLNSLLEQGFIEQRESKKLDFAPIETPGIFRLQHASILYRTKTTGILVDPHLHSDYELSVNNLSTNIHRSDLEGKVDAILISHSHEDHWHLSTLMMFSPEIPIFVPKVPQASIICDDMQLRLESLGFKNVIAVDWYSDPIVIGDIEINVLPFYGEQPLLYEHPKHKDLRNWGNTYLLRTDYYTSWLLIDSGNDAMGKTAEVALYVKKKFGTVDILLSNLREFFIFSPMYVTAGSYWLSLSSEQMRNFPSMKNHCTTLGVEGVAEIAQIVNARYFLPYAHWWNYLGQKGKREELDHLSELKQAMKNLGCPTVIVPWKIGDGYISTGIKKFDIVGIN
jgi:L-ascorbate metabolism protein UlaG (beta-lactamase superfamily)